MRRAVALMAVLCLGAAAPASSPVRQLAGRYSEHFLNGMVDGSTYWADNIVEVVPVDATHAFVQLSLEFYNGHQCGLSGIATASQTPSGWYGLTLGPPSRSLSRLPAARAESRTTSASSRNLGPRESRRFDGSFSIFSFVATADWRYVAELTSIL